MAVLALTSAKGAPGVSTAALAMTLLWPRAALLAECDPAGGSSVLAGYLRGTVEHSRGLLPLALAHRHDELEQALWSQTVATDRHQPGPAADGPGGPDRRWLLPGLSDAAQAPSTAALWGPLGSLLASLERTDVDVLVDAGRLGAAHAPTALLRQADLVLLVLGTSLPAVAAARARLAVLREDLAATSTAGSAPGRHRAAAGRRGPPLHRPGDRRRPRAAGRGDAGVGPGQRRGAGRRRRTRPALRRQPAGAQHPRSHHRQLRRRSHGAGTGSPRRRRRRRR